MLQIVDAQWKDHLYSLDHLKEGIGLRGYGQRDPLVEYKKESFALFQAMKDRVEEEIVRYLWRLTPVSGDDAAGRRRRRFGQPPPRRPPQQITLNSPQSAPPPSPFGAIGGNAPRRPGAAAAGAHRRRRRRSSRSSATSRRSDATIPARAAAARNTRSAMGLNRCAACTRLRCDATLEADRCMSAFSEDANGNTNRHPQHRPDRHRPHDRADVRRRAAGAAAFAGAAERGRRHVAGHAEHPRQRAAAQRGDGHRHRVAPGDRDGAAGRHRRHPQEPLGRGTGVRGRSRQAIRERHDRQPDHALAEATGSTKRST